jgi:hypothetical protein
MVTIVKHEWHQHDRQYAIELDEALLGEIYPDLDEDEIVQKLADIESGEIDYEEVLNDANENDVEIEWEFQYDDCWTDRKGGYEVTYELGDESSWHTAPEDKPATHKCTKCRWEGQSYDADWQWQDDEGNEYDEAKHVCPMCDSDLELTEHGVIEEEARKKRMAEIDAMFLEDEDELSDTEMEEALTELTKAVQELGEQIGASPEEVQAKWPFDNDADDDALKEIYPEDTYTIRIWGRTREIGVHKIKKAQYEHWSHEDHEDDLSDALNENYDYEENNTPKKAQFDLPYYEYQDKISFWGFDQDDTHMTIENSEGETIYEGDLDSFFSEVHGEEDSYYEVTEEQEELYPDYFGKGYWLYWTQGGKGSCIQTSIEGAFEPKKLKTLTWDIEGSSVVTRLVYDGDELDDEGMDSEHDNWRGQWSTFSVHHNEK